MNPVISYEGMIEILGEAFRTRYKRQDVNITGILLARPECEFAHNEILRHIDYWHHRSDQHTDFFCPGYIQDGSGQSGPIVATVGHERWCFSNHMFAGFLKQLEAQTSWRYGGGCELIVTNARYSERKRHASLDLSTAIAINLERAHEDKAVRDVTDLCEVLFEFAKNLNEASADPCWEFSNALGRRIVKGSLKEFLLHYLPAAVKPEARKAVHFVTTDLRPRN